MTLLKNNIQFAEKVAINNLSSLVPGPAGTLISYVAQNHKIVRRKPQVLFHPRKVLHAMPMTAAGVAIDTVYNGINHTPTTDVVFHFVKMTLTFL